MIRQSNARLACWLRVFFGVAFGLGSVTTAVAQCQNSDFRNLRVRTGSGDAQFPGPAEVSESRGAVIVNMPFGANSMGDAGITASPFDPTIAGIELNRWTWRLRAQTFGWASTNDLLVTYQFSNNDHLVSTIDPTSRIRVTAVRDRRDTRGPFGFGVARIRGFLELDLDLTTATRAGLYTGTLTVNIECR